MGTLFKQPFRHHCAVRKTDVIDVINEVKAISKETKLDINQVISIWQIQELNRKNNLYQYNGDVFDEQMAGFGELFEQLNRILSNISMCIENANKEDFRDFLATIAHNISNYEEN